MNVGHKWMIDWKIISFYQYIYNSYADRNILIDFQVVMHSLYFLKADYKLKSLVHCGKNH